MSIQRSSRPPSTPHSTTHSATQLRAALLAAASLGLAGCVNYLTPGPAAQIGGLAREHSGEESDAIPEAQFPSRIAVVRIQAPGYRSYDVQSVGSGRFSVVSVHEVEDSNNIGNIANWKDVIGVSQASDLNLPGTFHSLADLRNAAQNAQADILLVYTFDTLFHIENKTLSPQEILGLGVLPGREASVTTTISGVFVDSRSGFIYGSLERTAIERTLMTKWTKPSDADDTRLKAEGEAFKAMMADAETTWNRIVARYAPPPDTGEHPHDKTTFEIVQPTPPASPATTPTSHVAPAASSPAPAGTSEPAAAPVTESSETHPSSGSGTPATVESAPAAPASEATTPPPASSAP